MKDFVIDINEACPELVKKVENLSDQDEINGEIESALVCIIFIKDKSQHNSEVYGLKCICGEYRSRYLGVPNDGYNKADEDVYLICKKCGKISRIFCAELHGCDAMYHDITSSREVDKYWKLQKYMIEKVTNCSCCDEVKEYVVMVELYSGPDDFKDPENYFMSIAFIEYCTVCENFSIISDSETA